jgi:hypothetical protein
MANSPNLRLVDRKTDILCRKVTSEQWSKATGELLPTAFQDRHNNLSLYVLRCIPSFSYVLEIFAEFKPVQKACGTEGPPTARQMYDSGYRIAIVPASIVEELGLSYKILPGEHEIEIDGHVDVIEGQQYALNLLFDATMLTEAETFPEG